MEDEIKKLKDLLQRAYDHLEYCGWGDAWERDCSKDLKKELDEYFRNEPKGLEKRIKCEE